MLPTSPVRARRPAAGARPARWWCSCHPVPVTHGVVHDAIVSRVLRKPQRGAADEGGALLCRRQRDRLVRADAGRRSPHRTPPALRPRVRQVPAGAPAFPRALRLSGRAEQAQAKRWRGLTAPDAAQRTAPTPQRDRFLQLPKSSRTRSHSAAGTRCSPSAARRCQFQFGGISCGWISLQKRYQQGLPSIPAALRSPSPHAIAAFAHALERRVPGIPAARRSHRPARHRPAGCGRSAHQARLGHERGQRQGTKVALRADATPAVHWLAEDVKLRLQLEKCVVEIGQRRAGGPPPARTSGAAAVVLPPPLAIALAAEHLTWAQPLDHW